MGKSVRKKNDLSIPLDEIGESGYHLACTKKIAWVTDVLQEAGETDFSVSEDIKILVDLFRTGDGFEMRGVITTTIAMGCVRCLDNFTFPFKTEFHCSLCPSDELDSSHDMEVHKDDLDVLPYKGNLIDLLPVIGEQIIVNVPANPICKKSCKGICQQCGANLNRASCQCDKSERRGSAFEVLKDFQVKQKP
jgi:uncharacterized protein